MAQVIKKSDSQIQKDVLGELKWDTLVKETEVGVEVDSGVVTLTGTVSSWAKKMAAQDAAHRVAGVLDVANDLEVKWPSTTTKRTDTEIAQAIRQALEWDVFVPHERIQSTVDKGVVKLDGEVDYGSQRDAALRVVRNLEGVIYVTDGIRIKPAHVPPETVRKSIEDALERQYEREAKQITLEMRDGKAVLSGNVHSWAEREAVIGAARGTAGVQQVEDHLRINPYAP
jgi:osmotically-inducible protein OsmY